MISSTSLRGTLTKTARPDACLEMTLLSTPTSDRSSTTTVRLIANLPFHDLVSECCFAPESLVRYSPYSHPGADRIGSEEENIKGLSFSDIVLGGRPELS